jgi:hypothetical protein
MNVLITEFIYLATNIKNNPRVSRTLNFSPEIVKPQAVISNFAFLFLKGW